MMEGVTATALKVLTALPSTLVLWDVDHTLIENGGVSKETYALAFELITGALPAVQPATHGKTDFQIMRELLMANSVAANKYVGTSQFEIFLVEAMKKKASELPRRGYVLSGAVEALSALALAPAVLQSVLTGNIAHNATVKLSSFGLDPWIDLDIGGYGSDDVVRAKLVDVARQKVHNKHGLKFDRFSTILVGDTPLDVKAGRDGGARVIGVATGVYGADTLERAGADITLNNLGSLDEFSCALADVRCRRH
jgi:phosphoglycolate phosphatase-like HAD superfamily hydrolase